MAGLLLLGACSSSTTPALVGDGGSSADASTATFIRLSECLSQPLSVGTDGLVTARVFVALAASSACKDANLSDADAATVSSLQTQAGVAVGAIVCEVPQAKPADYVNGSCVASTKPGFCYVAPWDLPATNGGAGRHCDQTILFSAAVGAVKVSATYLEP